MIGVEKVREKSNGFFWNDFIQYGASDCEWFTVSARSHAFPPFFLMMKHVSDNPCSHIIGSRNHFFSVFRSYPLPSKSKTLS